MLTEYTIHELLYEYYDKIERKRAVEMSFEQEADKIEDEKFQEALDWAEEEEQREREEAEAKEKAKADEQWMLDQLKKEHGEDFGDDLNLDLSE